MKNKRSPEEIKQIFEEKGCAVEIEELGASYRAGGQIFIYAPGVDREKGLNFALADFEGFYGTGYDGRGRYYSVWLVTAGDYVPATAAEYGNAAEDRRFQFGAESRSCSNLRYFVHKDELAKKGLVDLTNAFEALGL